MLHLSHTDGVPDGTAVDVSTEGDISLGSDPHDLQMSDPQMIYSTPSVMLGVVVPHAGHVVQCHTQ